MSNFECECDDDMTPDGHSPKCANSILSEHARGVAAERARVVADLRARADECEERDSETADGLRADADRYERGEHDKEGER